MSYEPTNWKAGDTVTSAKLNKLEQGIKNSILVANYIHENSTAHLDKTWQEIYNADFCIVNYTEQDGTITTSFVGVKTPAEEGGKYIILVFSPGSTKQLMLSATTPADYPSNAEQMTPSDGR